MEKTAVQRLAKVLKLLIRIVFVMNLFCLLLVPSFSALIADECLEDLLNYLRNELPNYTVHTLGHVLMFCANAFLAVWVDLRASLFTVFFWLCGICTATILWQAMAVLDTVLMENPFQPRNAKALRRAAVCCWIISGVALLRLVWWLRYEHTAAPLFTYNTLFIFAFLMAGLLFQVMSALFRQAAELKEDQDLTI